MSKPNEDYVLTVRWSADDECFIARCDDWAGIVGTGGTVFQAIESLHSAWADTVSACPDITERPRVLERVATTSGTGGRRWAR